MRHPVSVGVHIVHDDFAHVKCREFEHGSVSRAKRRIVRTRCRQEGCTTAEGSRRIPQRFCVTGSLQSDGEDALRHVISNAAGKAGQLSSQLFVERDEANRLSDQRVRHFCWLLQALIEDARARGLACSLEHMIAWWANKRTNWETSDLVILGLEVEGGCVVQQKLT